MTLSQACKELMMKEPFYGLLFLNLDKYFSKQVPTAGVSLRGVATVLEVNETYWNSITPLNQLAVIKHELMHIAFAHLFMRTSFSDFNLFNIAADIEVNQYITNLPENCYTLELVKQKYGLTLPQRAGTKVYYEILQQYNQENPDNQIGTEGDIHESWKVFDELSDVEKELVRRQTDYVIKETANQTLKNRGTIPAELSEIIKELFKIVAPIFNWKAYFRRLLGNSFKIYTKKSNRKLSKRFEESAGIKIKHKHHILVGVDTSGSVSQEELLEFFSEITHIFRAGVQVTIVECDAKIQRIYPYTGKFNGTISGRGGTDFQPVIDHFNNNLNLYTTLIYFTDGEAPSDSLKPKKRMIWVLSSQGHHNDFYPGAVIKIPKQQNG